MMRSFIVGIVAAFVAAALCVIVQVALSVTFDVWRQAGSGGVGGGGIAGGSVEVPNIPLLACAAAGFALAFWWHRRRRVRML